MPSYRTEKRRETCSFAMFLFWTGAGDHQEMGCCRNKVCDLKAWLPLTLLVPLSSHKPGSVPCPILCSCKFCYHINLQNRLPNPSVCVINHDKAMELILIYRTFQAIDINICKLYGGTSWWFEGMYGHMANLPDRFRGICCYLFNAREKHSLLSPYSYMCLPFKYVNSAHRPSVFSKGRERDSTGISWIVLISKQSLFN